eukprot:15470766-Alexandrium_andersonii.AAC.1
MVELLGEVEEGLAVAGVKLVRPPEPPAARPFSGPAPWPESLGPDVSYVDDVLIAVTADPQGLADAVAKAAMVIVSVSARYGMEVNLKRGKTEAMCVFHGRCSRLARVDLLIHRRGLIE